MMLVQEFRPGGRPPRPPPGTSGLDPLMEQEFRYQQRRPGGEPSAVPPLTRASWRIWPAYRRSTTVADQDRAAPGRPTWPRAPPTGDGRAGRVFWTGHALEAESSPSPGLGTPVVVLRICNSQAEDDLPCDVVQRVHHAGAEQAGFRRGGGPPGDKTSLRRPLAGRTQQTHHPRLAAWRRLQAANRDRLPPHVLDDHTPDLLSKPSPPGDEHFHQAVSGFLWAWTQRHQSAGIPPGGDRTHPVTEPTATSSRSPPRP
jgi:hypothetical protein